MFYFPRLQQNDYKRADDLAKLVADKVFYGNVNPSWIGNTGTFFYETNTPDGIEYLTGKYQYKVEKK